MDTRGVSKEREELRVELASPCYTAWETFPQNNKNSRNIEDTELTILGQDLQNRWFLHHGLLPIVHDAEMLQSLARWWHPLIEMTRIAQPQICSFLRRNRLGLQLGFDLDSELTNAGLWTKIVFHYLPEWHDNPLHPLLLTTRVVQTLVAKALILWSSCFRFEVRDIVAFSSFTCVLFPSGFIILFTANVAHRADVLSSLLQTLAHASSSCNVSRVLQIREDPIYHVK